ncbi:MAG: Trk system potassium transporter TrkA [Gemmatimonadetes bacterium]|nr:Trk system potassium transporter TrkA [Gemmatimonadota bacterium]
MKVIIIGAGEVGFHLAERLSEENQDVVVIESDPDRAEETSDQLDVMTIVGNGASLPVLERAGVRGANILMAVTSKDEVNLIACLAGARMGVGYTIARVSNPEYHASGSVLSQDVLGIDLMINPARESAWETFHLLRSPAATDVASFANGRLQLLGLMVKEGAPLTGKTLAQLDQELEGMHYLLTAILRDQETIIPTGTTRIEAGDQVYLLSLTTEAHLIPPLAGYEEYRLRRVMIAGGSPEGAYLAEILAQYHIEATIIERDRKRCVELAEALPKALVLNGDATDLELLELEGVAGMDGYLAATSSDDTNMLSSLIAKQAGAKKVVSLINELDYLPLAPKVGIDAAVSPRISAVNAILRYVHRGRVTSVATLKGIGAETIQFTVTKDSQVAGKALRDLALPKGSLIGSIIRGDDLMIPRGDSVIRPGDEVIVFALPDAISEIERAFE